MGQVGMAVAQRLLLVAVLLLVPSGLHCFSSPAACPESCIGQRAPLLNCSSSGLFLVPQCIQDSVTQMDLSHNLLSFVTLHRPHHNLRNVWLGNNTITHLSLCIERSLRSQFVRDIQLRRLRPWSRRGCVSWAPNLQLLSVERNQLEQLPKGLEGSESLQVLQLSFNRISTLRPGDLSQLRQLKELHLQHNLIASLHSQMFQDLTQLRVLDLSFNMLTSVHPFMYLSLHTIGADVRLDGNRWQCDCSMRHLRRRMAYDSSRGFQTWSIMCASPSILSDKDLLQLEEDDLNCFSAENRPELHQDVTVNSGSEILLSCSTQDSLFWTPTGQSSVSQPQAGLLINDIKERDTGLYVCVSEEHEVVSVFNLQISKIGGTRRHTRSLPRSSQQIISQDAANRVGQERNVRAAQSKLTLAVCLSVFITFLVAFILGVLARPFIDILWKKLTNKKRSSAANSVSSMDQRQYDNEAFSSGEEPLEIPPYRERRVTFSTVDFREDNNVIYYDTVASGEQESINNDAVIECEVAEEVTHKAGDSEGENTLRHEMKFEHIPDSAELEERRSLSSSSDSSLSDKVLNEEQMTKEDCNKPRSSQLGEDSVQQRSDLSAATEVEVPQISIENRSENPGFSSEPFPEWSPHSNNTHPVDLDLWQDNEEQFEFSDSVRSTCSSVFDSFNDVTASSDKQKRDDMSSSSSYVSEDEPTQYTVNSDQEEEKGDTRDKVTLDLGHITHTKRHLNIRAPSLSSDSSSSTDSEGETTYDTDRPGKVETAELPFQESPIVSHLSKTQFPALDLEHIPCIESRLDIKAPSLDLISSSSSDSDDEATRHTERPGKVDVVELPLQKSVSHDQHARWPIQDLEHIPRINRRLDIKAPSPASDSSSSSDTEDETTHHTETPMKVNIAELPLQKTQTSDNPEALWPAVDLGNITCIKRRLDIKGSSPPPDLLLSGGSRMNRIERKREEANQFNPYYSSTSSDEREEDKAPSLPSDSSTSSDSADETTNHTEKQRPQTVNILYKEPQSVSHDPDARWPTLDLQHIPHIKRRLDIKPPSPPPDQSSNHDIMEEKIPQMKKHEQGEFHITELPFKESESESCDLETRWPALDLEKTTSIKRRLDIKASSSTSDSSSHSDSENETTHHIKKEEQVEIHMARLPVTTSQTHDAETQWPVVDLEHTTCIKRRLDIRAPSPASASSESENEIADHTEKQRPSKTDITELPLNDPDRRWPALDLDHLPHITRRLDIKALSPCPDLSSNINKMEDNISQIKKHKQGVVHITKTPDQEFETTSHDPETKRPTLDLHHTTRIKRRLDIKAPSQDFVSSSSSDSDDEMTNRIKKQEQVEIHMARLPVTSQTHDAETQWPVVDLEHTTRIKRRLDIRAPSPDSHSSASSESENEIADHTEKQRPSKTDITELPLNDPDRRWPALDLDHLPHITRRLDIKALSPCPDLSSNINKMEDNISQIKKHKQGVVHITKTPDQEFETTSHDPETKWPTLDLHHTTRIKRRLDIKAPSQDFVSSSSSDSDDEMTNRIKKQEQMEIHMARLPVRTSQTRDAETQWPVVDLEHTTRIKRRLDIKAPSQDFVSSSSSDSDDEMTNRIKKQEQMEIHMARLPVTSQTHDAETQWPLVDLEHTTRIKRRLDIRAPSPDSHSSASSESENEIADHTEKQRPSKTDITELPLNDPDRRWPALDLDHLPHITRRLDIKALSPCPDLSSNINKMEDNISQIKKHKQGVVHITKTPDQEFETTSHDPETKRPTLDLHHTTRIKRRLDIKAPSQDFVSSSSSDSDDEMTNHIKKQEQVEIHMARLPVTSQTHDAETQWPVVDLEHTTRIKRRLDIKAPSQDFVSSSSSDSDDEMTNHIKKQEQVEIHMARLPVTSQTHDAETQWPVVDLEHTTRIKRRLDIRAPSPDSHSSASSESENEIADHTEKQRPSKTDITELPLNDPDRRWPALDLDHLPHITRRLDIKALSPCPDLSSNINKMEDNISQIKKHKQGVVHITKTPDQEFETTSHDPETKWPTLDLHHTTRIKRRLDIKAPSQDFVSSSSSDSDDEMTNRIKKQEQMEIHMARLPVTSQTHDAETQWPLVDLEHTTRIKRRLDIKAPSQDFVSSSSSDSDDEMTNRIKKQEQMEIHMARLPVRTSQTRDAETQWPVVDLEHTTRIKRRLDIKAPSQDFVSSSSSDSDDEIAVHTEKQGPAKLDMAEIPLNDPDTRWPALDLEHLPHIKRHLDIRSPCPNLSSNIEIVEDKISQIKKHEQGEVYITKLPFQESEAESHEQETKWPTLDLEHTIHIKRRLDIKAPSQDPDSSSSSGSDDETLNYRKKQRPGVMQIAGLPYQESQIVRHDPETGWPALVLEHSTRIKRRLDIKAPSPASDSSSSSDSEDKMTHPTERPGKVNAIELLLQKSQTSDNPETQWPAVDLINITHIKRRLDIKGPSLPPDSLLSGGSRIHSKEGKREEANKICPYYSSSSSDEQKEAIENVNSLPIKVVPDLDPRLPELSIRSSNTPMLNISRSPKTEHNIKLIKYTVITDDLGEMPTSDNRNTIPERNPELQSRWATMNLGISRFRKHLEITSHKSPSYISSETDGGGTSQLPVVTDKGPSQNTMSKSETEEVERMARIELNIETPKVAVESNSVWPHLDLTNIPTVKRALDIKAPVQTESSSCSNSEDETIHHSIPDLSVGVPCVKRRLNIKAPTPEHSNSPSFSSENENEVTRYTAKGSRYTSNMSGMTDNDSLITYKRLIMKASSPPSESFSPSDKSQSTYHAEMVTVVPESSSQGDRNASLVPRKHLSINFDEVVKQKTDQSRRTANVDLPPEIRWTGIGHHLSDLPSSKRFLDADLSSPQPSPPAQPEQAPTDSFNFSSNKSHNNLKPDRGKEYATPMHSYSALSASSVSLASSRALDHFDNSTSNKNEIQRVLSEERKERKGLSALKAMSTERRKWDTEYENFNSASSLYHDPQGDSSFNNRRSEEDIKPLAKQRLTHLSSASLVGRRAADMLYGIPSYRRHDAGDVEPPQEAPPPVPATPPPDEGVELRWTTP